MTAPDAMRRNEKYVTRKIVQWERQELPTRGRPTRYFALTEREEKVSKVQLLHEKMHGTSSVGQRNMSSETAKKGKALRFAKGTGMESFVHQDRAGTLRKSGTRNSCSTAETRYLVDRTGY